MRRSALVVLAILAAAGCDSIPTENAPPKAEDPAAGSDLVITPRGTVVPVGKTVVEDNLVWTPSGAAFSKAEWQALTDKTTWLKSFKSLMLGMEQQQKHAGMQLSVSGLPAPRVLCYTGAFACTQIPTLLPGATVTFWNDAQWSAATTAAFASFDLIYIHDIAGAAPGLVNSRSRWGPAIVGRVVLTGTHFEHCNSPDPAIPPSPGACTVLRSTLEWIHAGNGTGLLASTQRINDDYLPLNFPFVGVTYPVINGGFDHVHIIDPGHATMAGSTDASLSNFLNSSHSLFGGVGGFTVVANVCRDGTVRYPNPCGAGFAPYFLVFSPADQDGDGISDHVDNCPTVANTDQTDANNNGVGDACESAPTVSISPKISTVLSGTAITFTTSADDSDDGPGVLTYSWRVGGIVQPGANGPTFTQAFSANATVRVTVRDPGNLTGFDEANVTVVTNRPPVADGGGPYTSSEGSSLNLDGTASSDLDGDDLTYDWDFGDGSAHGSGPSPSHTYADNGSYPITLIVSDGLASATATATATIGNLSPNVGSVSVPVALVAVNTAVSASAPYTDPGTLDTHTGSIDWDDGSSSAATISGTNGSGSASGTHTYTTAGVYSLVLSVTDKDGATGQSVFQYVVVYDPAAGFVTGGGWITSPAGAYSANLSMTGKATFGFVSKYQKGATTPKGNTEFQFQAAGLSFSSASYEWLVIAGARAQYKGVGTINGGGSYGFLLTAIDGQESGGGGIDQFRLKIWDQGTGSTIYDNQPGAADDAANATQLSGGSIVIHK
jgi:PKD repeat protein